MNVYHNNRTDQNIGILINYGITSTDKNHFNKMEMYYKYIASISVCILVHDYLFCTLKRQRSIICY